MTQLIQKRLNLGHIQYLDRVLSTGGVGGGGKLSTGGQGEVLSTGGPGEAPKKFS